MKKVIILFILLLGFNFSFGQDVETIETAAAVDTQIVLEGNETLGELIESLEGDTRTFIEMLRDGDFPPKSTNGWIAFLLSFALPFIMRITAQRAKYLDIFKRIRAEGNTNAIIVWVSLALAGIYEVVTSGWAFDFSEFGGYAMVIYGLGMGVNEIIRAFSKKETPESVG